MALLRDDRGKPVHTAEKIPRPEAALQNMGLSGRPRDLPHSEPLAGVQYPHVQPLRSVLRRSPHAGRPSGVSILSEVGEPTKADPPYIEPAIEVQGLTKQYGDLLVRANGSLTRGPPFRILEFLTLSAFAAEIGH